MPILAAVAVMAVLWLGIAYGSRAAGGADAFGYVSQAYLWLKGDLRIDQSWSRAFDWPHREESVRPLGYRWGENRTGIVPTYAPGLPLIMAAFDRLFGTCGPYYVTPVFAALLVGGTFALAWRLSRSAVTASLAAILMAASPAFLFNLMFPMSDIVTTSLWTWAIVFLTWPGVRAAAFAGIAAGVATIVRPNLVPVAVAGLAAAALWSGDRPTRTQWLARLVTFSVPVVIGALFIARLNQTLYGAAFESGYGATSSLYALSHVRTNIVQFTSWLFESETYAVLLALLPIACQPLRPDWLTARAGVPLALLTMIVLASYLFYLPFDQWWYLRFLLPLFPILFLFLGIALSGLWRATVRSPAAVTMVTVILLTAYRWSFAHGHGVLGIGYDEQRYVAVGQYIDRALPANAVLLSMQHSGSIRYYSGRPTIRYDLFTAARFPSVVNDLPRYGYRPYIVLDDWEEQQYRARMGEATSLARLELRVLAEMTSPVRVRIYEPVPVTPGDPPPDPIPIRRSRACAGPKGAWAP